MSDLRSSALRRGASRPGRHAMRRFLSHRLAVVGLVVIACSRSARPSPPGSRPTVPTTSRSSPATRRHLPPGHLVGSDDLGRDVLTGSCTRARFRSRSASPRWLVTVIVGFAIGAFAAYLGGWVDVVLMRLTDMMLCFPSVFLLLFVAAFVTPTSHQSR